MCLYLRMCNYMFSSIAVASQNPTVQDYLVPQILSTNKGWYGINNTYLYRVI